MMLNDLTGITFLHSQKTPFISLQGVIKKVIKKKTGSDMDLDLDVNH